MKPHAKTDVPGVGERGDRARLMFLWLVFAASLLSECLEQQAKEKYASNLFLLEFLQPLLFFLIFLMSMQCLFSIMSKADVQ